jgi:phosphoribosylaminoimidazole-succinocarboxamide synthase
MSEKTPIYEGKAKKLFEGPEPGTLIAYYKDDATAFNNKKRGNIQGKGIINNKISEYMMTRLSEMGIPTHFIRGLNMREQLVHAVDIIPLEVIIRNYAAGSFSERFGAEEGEPLGSPLFEFCLKDDRLGDPFISEDHILAFGIADPDEIEELRHYALRINDYLSGLFHSVGIRLIDLKLEFGRFYEGEYEQIVLADEISPDTCRLWDLNTNDKLDKDRFRRDLGGAEDAYREVARRLGVLPSANVVESDVFAGKQKKATKKRAGASAKAASSRAKKPAIAAVKPARAKPAKATGKAAKATKPKQPKK